MKVRYTEPAAEEVDAGILYLLKHVPAMAADFSDSIKQAIEVLVVHPYSAQETEMHGVRRCHVRRFRHSIFHKIEGDELLILYIQHTSRDLWKNK